MCGIYKNRKKIFLICLGLCFVFVLSSCTPPLPSITVITSMPPKDFDVVLIVNGETEFKVSESRVAWEVQFCFEYYGWKMEDYAKNGIEYAVLRITAHNETFEVDIDAACFDDYHSVVTLNVKNKNITYGKPLGRSIFLVSLRSVLGLAAMGSLFYLFGYRKKRSWVSFAIINLPGEVFINILIDGTSIYREAQLWILGCALFYGIFVFAIKSIAMCIAVNEHKKLKTFLYVYIASNAGFWTLLVSTMFLPF